MAHSPFPWKIHPASLTAVFDANGEKVAATAAGHIFPPIYCDVAEANAALIASIPDMVKALEGIAEFCSTDGSTPGAIARLTYIRNAAQDALAVYRSHQK